MLLKLLASLRWRRLPPELEAIRSSKAFKDAMDRNARLAKLPSISFAFVDVPLPNGVVTIVRLNQPDSLGRYAIVSESTFDNSVLMFCYCGARWFESQREDDDSPATVTVYHDGRTEATSQQLGETMSTRIVQTILTTRLQQVGGADKSRQAVGPDKSRRAARMLKRLSKAPSHDAPGFGAGRVVQR